LPIGAGIANHIRLVGRDEAADNTVPDGNQTHAMRFPVQTAYKESPMAKP